MIEINGSSSEKKAAAIAIAIYHAQLQDVGVWYVAPSAKDIDALKPLLLHPKIRLSSYSDFKQIRGFAATEQLLIVDRLSEMHHREGDPVKVLMHRFQASRHEPQIIIID